MAILDCAREAASRRVSYEVAPGHSQMERIGAHLGSFQLLSSHRRRYSWICLFFRESAPLVLFVGLVLTSSQCQESRMIISVNSINLSICCAYLLCRKLRWIVFHLPCIATALQKFRQLPSCLSRPV